MPRDASRVRRSGVEGGRNVPQSMVSSLVEGFRVGVWVGLELGVWGLGFGVRGSGFKVEDLGCRVHTKGSRI
jgi:hypothetical protein